MPPLGTEAQLKVALMRAIDSDLKRRYRTLAQAAEAIGPTITWQRLSRIRSGRHEYFSINWLFRLADAAHVHIRISVDPVNR